MPTPVPSGTIAPTSLMPTPQPSETGTGTAELLQLILTKLSNLENKIDSQCGSANSCANGVKDNGETDIDCGGASNNCPRCPVASRCQNGSDCVTHNCIGGYCVPSYN